ncbi:DUF2752 domain-containing protein [candidate division KSB1 bacterium]|nr:DUF2752 domain-containing protein [candidate division KSB1 bacterium]
MFFRLANRKILYAIFFFFFIAILAKQFNFDIWYCPIKSATGIKCPGCGMVTSLLHIVKGNWTAALQSNPFAYFFFPGFLVLLIISLLPEPCYGKSLHFLDRLEKKSHLIHIILFLFVCFGLSRALCGFFCDQSTLFNSYIH